MQENIQADLHEKFELMQNQIALFDERFNEQEQMQQTIVQIDERVRELETNSNPNQNNNQIDFEAIEQKLAEQNQIIGLFDE